MDELVKNTSYITAKKQGIRRETKYQRNMKKYKLQMSNIRMKYDPKNE